MLQHAYSNFENGVILSVGSIFVGRKNGDTVLTPERGLLISTAVWKPCQLFSRSNFRMQ